MSEQVDRAAIRRAREEVDLEKFYAHKRVREAELSRVKRAYRASNIKVWRNLVWLGFSILVVALAFFLIRFVYR